MLSSKTISIVKATAPVLAVKGEEITTHFYQSLFTNHPELLNIFNHANQKKGRQQTALANTVYAAATYIDQLEVLLPAVKKIAHKHRSLVVKPEHYPIVGKYLIESIKAVLGKDATDEILAAWKEAYQVIADVFISVEKEMYEACDWTDFKAFKVVKKVKESRDISSFYLKPIDGQKLPSFLPGQYITIRLNIPGTDNLFNRQYSLSDVPNQEYFRISVKREAEEDRPHGIISNYLHDSVEVGTTLEVTAPAGEFTLQTDQQSPLYLLSGGVGITPLLCMLKSLPVHQTKRETTFIHATKNGESHAFKKEVEEVMATLENGKAHFIFEKPTAEDKLKELYHFEGYVTKQMLEEMKIDVNGQFYICGPVPFMKAIIFNLEDLGVSAENIHYEFFGPAIELKKEEIQL
ncbi:Flavohemoprotein [Bacillus sp. THAF10]|uniref:NO-inducible flavohemoprotein n=1 Tax=Bacillus sp. THAF10 TaxID=2587848 RepID=UPI0012693AE1|nr:NO-inducible flavohemoprotein [Bacillus sp. THAF10]QFT88225.1 Flavohemoprotein [Bacillus sp. THAF10]